MTIDINTEPTVASAADTDFVLVSLADGTGPRRVLRSTFDTLTGLTVTCAASGVTAYGTLEVARLAAPLGVTAGAPADGGSFSGATYYWVVTSYNSIGETLKSLQVTATPATNQKVTISWTAAPGAGGYKIYRSTTSNTYGATSLVTTITDGATVSYTDTGTATTTGAPPTTTPGNKVKIQMWSGQTNNALSVVDLSDNHVFVIDSTGAATFSQAATFSGAVTCGDAITVNGPLVANDACTVSGSLELKKAGSYALFVADATAQTVTISELSGGTPVVIFDVSTGALPTADPNVAGQVWNSAGTLKISAG